jgi:hypothetical protein
MFKNHYIKSNHRVLRKNEEDTYGPPFFAPDYSATGLAAKMCTNSDEHSKYNPIYKAQNIYIYSYLIEI